MNVNLRGAWINTSQIDANKVYAILCCIAYWLDAMGYGVEFKTDLEQLILLYPSVDAAAMGFPKSWRQEPLWQ